MAQKKPKFRTHFERVIMNCPTGERVEMRHRAFMHENGKRELIKDKAVDIYNLIQSHKEECEIENIIRRAVEGDYNALNLVNGTYMDVTDCPSNLAQAQQIMIDLKQKFAELPKDIRAKFDFNEEQFIAEYGTQSWADKTGYSAALEKEKEIQKSKIKFDEDLTKAIQNLAGSGAVTTEGGGSENE